MNFLRKKFRAREILIRTIEKKRRLRANLSIRASR